MTGIRALHAAVLASYYGRHKQNMERDYVLFRVLYRPLSMPLTTLLLRVGATANGVTAAGLVLLLAALAVMCLPTPYAWLGIAGYCLFWVLDFVDGNIARFHGTSSYFGKLIDGMVDTMGFLVFAAAAAYSVNHDQGFFGWKIELALGMATTFAALLRQNYMFRLAHLKREAGLAAAVGTPPPDTPVRQRGRMRRLVWLFDNLAVSQPVLLPLAAATGTMGAFVLLFFVLHGVFGTAAVAASIVKNQRELASVERQH